MANGRRWQREEWSTCRAGQNMASATLARRQAVTGSLRPHPGLRCSLLVVPMSSQSLRRQTWDESLKSSTSTESPCSKANEADNGWINRYHQLNRSITGSGRTYPTTTWYIRTGAELSHFL